MTKKLSHWWTGCLQFLDSAPLLVLQAELLTGSPVSNVEEAHRAGQELLKRGCGSVIITLGPQGCVVVEAQGSASRHVQTTSVKSVDTTVSMTRVLSQWISYDIIVMALTIHKNNIIVITIENWNTTINNANCQIDP